jgi:hypothetical protein
MGRPANQETRAEDRTESARGARPGWDAWFRATGRAAYLAAKALRMNRLNHELKLPTKPGYVHEGPWPYPDSDKRRAYMRNYMRERRGLRERKRKSAAELREYKRNWMRAWREANGR